MKGNVIGGPMHGKSVHGAGDTIVLSHADLLALIKHLNNVAAAMMMR